MDAGRIVEHLVEISKGECSITEASIMKMDNEDEQRVLLGLLTLHEEIQYNKTNLEKSLKEKEVLMQEIHHRVKNNLQIITSLLKLQNSVVSDDHTRSVLGDCQSRVNTMALVHNRLLNSRELEKVDFKEYVIDLVDDLMVMYHNTVKDLKVDLDIVRFTLPLDTAIPLGLVINEILTNSMKYGQNKDGAISLYCHVEEESLDSYVIRIGDHGPGYPTPLFKDSADSLGMQLIHDLIAQLDGKVEKMDRKGECGTHYEIRFGVVA